MLICQKNTQIAYDVASMSANLDFINLMSYDFHGSSWEKTLADHHSPLYKRTGETTNLNSDYAVNYWISKGMPASKINMGVPLYGQSWTLTSNAIVPPAPASGGAPAGLFTGTSGILAYYEICNYVRTAGWQVVQDPTHAIGPYAVSPTSPKYWVGYDDPAMATIKSNYALSKGLGGIMLWDISTDDFHNTCGAGVNPVTTAILNTLKGTSPSTTTTTTSPLTTTTSAATTTTTTKATTTTKSSGPCKLHLYNMI